MSQYQNYGVDLTKGQIEKILNAKNKRCSVTIELSKNDLNGNIKLPLTKTQINKIQAAVAASKGVQLTLSTAQLKYMEKSGGFLPLLSLIPIIAGAVGAAGGLTGGIASAVSAAKSNAEQARHNKEVETLLKTGSGIISNVVDPIPIVGKALSNALKKIGLGGSVKKLQGVKWGNGIYLERKGSGLFLKRQGA